MKPPVCSKHVVVSPVHLWSVCMWWYVRVQRPSALDVQRHQHPLEDPAYPPGDVSSLGSPSRFRWAVPAGLCASSVSLGQSMVSMAVAQGRNRLSGSCLVTHCRVWNELGWRLACPARLRSPVCAAQL